jgi:hypothetical protein
MTQLIDETHEKLKFSGDMAKLVLAAMAKGVKPDFLATILTGTAYSTLSFAGIDADTTCECLHDLIEFMEKAPPPPLIALAAWAEASAPPHRTEETIQ